MSGRRCKALRRAFAQAHGRRPSRATKPYGWARGIVSEWRRLKKGGARPARGVR